MKLVRFSAKEFNDLKEKISLYTSAMKTMQTRLEILREDYKNNDPFEHIKARIKSFESIAGKLKRKGLPLTADSAIKNLSDIAGIRIICSFAHDIDLIAAAIKRQDDLILIKESDYVKDPKSNGYRSYHMILTVPVYLTDRVEQIKTEIQIRTQAMDFWASLEHKARYKYESDVPVHLIDELKQCADKINDLDERMYHIHNEIHSINK